MENNSLHILFGFNDSELRKKLKEYLSEKGYTVEIEEKYTKYSIKEYINFHLECNTVILKEAWGDMNYKAEEVAELADLRDLNIIIVVGSEHKGTAYMQTLYAAGITSALFHVGRKGGIRLGTLADLIIDKRTRKAARVYYGIADEQIDLGYLAYDAFIEYADALYNKEYGRNLIERFVTVATRMTPKQLEDYIRRLPDGTVGELQQYEAYYKVVVMLKQYNIDLRYKKPKKFKKPENAPVEMLCTNEEKQQESEISPLFGASMMEDTGEDDDDTFCSTFVDEMTQPLPEEKKMRIHKEKILNKALVGIMVFLVTMIVVLLILLANLLIHKGNTRSSVCNEWTSNICCVKEIESDEKGSANI